MCLSSSKRDISGHQLESFFDAKPFANLNVLKFSGAVVPSVVVDDVGRLGVAFFVESNRRIDQIWTEETNFR